MKTVVMVYDLLGLEDVKSSKYIDCIDTRKYIYNLVKIKHGKSMLEVRQPNDDYIKDVVNRIKESNYNYVAIRYDKCLMETIKKNFNFIIVIPSFARYIELKNRRITTPKTKDLHLFKTRQENEFQALDMMLSTNVLEDIIKTEEYVFILGENKFFKDFIKMFFKK